MAEKGFKIEVTIIDLSKVFRTLNCNFLSTYFCPIFQFHSHWYMETWARYGLSKLIVLKQIILLWFRAIYKRVKVGDSAKKWWKFQTGVPMGSTLRAYISMSETMILSFLLITHFFNIKQVTTLFRQEKQILQSINWSIIFPLYQNAF